MALVPSRHGEAADANRASRAGHRPAVVRALARGFRDERVESRRRGGFHPSGVRQGVLRRADRGVAGPALRGARVPHTGAADRSGPEPLTRASSCRCGSVALMGRLHYGPARVPSRETPETAIALLNERGYTACEIDFEGGFWMDYPWAELFGELAREADIALSVHAPIAGFMGHAERGRKLNMAVGMLDHSAGIATACGAELVVFHPGFLLGRERADALDAVVEQLAFLRERLEGKGRAVPFGVEVMGRVRELGTPEDVFAISARLG